MIRSTALFLAPLALAAAPLADFDAENVDVANDDFDPPVAVDLDPDPDVIEIELVAQQSQWEYYPGVPTEVYNYNGSIPGPTIVGKVGDIVRVHFTNELPEATTIHWHGLELPANMDGSHIAQLHVQPGESFEYEFPLLRDGLYWYHPHVRTFDQVERGLYGTILVRDPALEASLGWDKGRIEEHIVVFDDILLDANLQVVPAFSMTDPIEKTLYALNGREGNHLLLNGKAAGVRSLTVQNGKIQRWHVLNAANTTFCRLDLNTDARVPMIQIGTDSGIIDRPIVRTPVIPLDPPSPTRQTAPERAAKLAAQLALEERSAPTRTAEELPTELALDEFATSAPHTVPQDEDQGILLVPGERMDVMFAPVADDGDRLRVFQFDWFRGRHFAEYDENGEIVLGDLPQDGRFPAKFYMHLDVVGPRPKRLPKIPTKLRDIEYLDPADAIGNLPVFLGHTLPDPLGNVKMFAQVRFDPIPGGGVQMVPLPAPLIDSFAAHDVEMGQTWIWELTNGSHGDHPFHTHGFFLEPYEIQYIDQDFGLFNITVPVRHRLIKDTVRLPARSGFRGRSKTIVRAVVHFDDRGRTGQAFAEGALPTFDRDGNWTSGGWLFHCHVLEHSGLGMLSFYEVHDPESAYRLLGKHLAGSLGAPSLTGHGNPVPGRRIEFDLVDALPNATVTLALGRTLNLLPFAGGTVVPKIEAFVYATTDDRGHATFQVPGWENLPAGTLFYAQAGFPDAGAAGGFAMSNAVSCQLP